MLVKNGTHHLPAIAKSETCMSNVARLIRSNSKWHDLAKLRVLPQEMDSRSCILASAEKRPGRLHRLKVDVVTVLVALALGDCTIEQRPCSCLEQLTV
eukprot:1473781-Pyramimonas_sp.AAC.1